MVNIFILFITLLQLGDCLNFRLSPQVKRGLLALASPFTFDNTGYYYNKERVGPLEDEDLEARKGAMAYYYYRVDLKVTSWRQKSQESWLKGVDRNTQISHRMVQNQFRRNDFGKLTINRVGYLRRMNERMGCQFFHQFSNFRDWRPNIKRSSLELQKGWLWRSEMRLFGKKSSFMLLMVWEVIWSLGMMISQWHSSNVVGIQFSMRWWVFCLENFLINSFLPIKKYLWVEVQE